MGKRKITEEKFILVLWFISPGEVTLCERWAQPGNVPALPGPCAALFARRKYCTPVPNLGIFGCLSKGAAGVCWMCSSPEGAVDVAVAIAMIISIKETG